MNGGMAIIKVGIVLLGILYGMDLSGQPSGKPPLKVGLVLSGGGARGFAHIGVLRALEDMNIPVHFVIGTSMGSVVGGLYASGLSVNELETVVLETDWNDLFDDDPPREKMSYRRKKEEREDLFDFELGLGMDGLKVGSGLITGKKLGGILRGMTLHVADIPDFNQLPIPFRAVATDLVNGEPVVIGRGDLARAMWGSMAVPGVFPAVEIEGRFVVDGGLVSNLPVEIIREFGVDVIIAVDITTPPRTHPETGSMVEVAMQSIDLLTYNNVVRSVVELNASDVLIMPDLNDLSSTDFDKQAQFIARGYAATRELAPKLKQLSMEPQAFSAMLEERHISPSDYIAGTVVDIVEIKGLKKMDPRLINARLKTRPGSVLDLSVLRQDLYRIDQLGVFETLGYRVNEVDGKTRLVIDAVEDTRGPGYLRLGLKLSSTLNGSGQFTVFANYRRVSVNRLGAEWKTAGSFGEVESIYTELYQPIDYSGNWFVTPRFEIIHDTDVVFLDSGELIPGEIKSARARLDFGRTLGNYGEIRLGLYNGQLEASKISGEILQQDIGQGGVELNIDIDSMDGADFPRFGFLGSVNTLLSRDSFGADHVYDKLTISLIGIRSLGNSTFLGSTELSSNLGTQLPFYDAFHLGGLFRLSGLEPNRLQGQVSGLARFAWYRSLVELPAMLGGNLYAGFGLEAGNAWADIHQAELGDLKYGGMAFLGAETALGPVFLAHGSTEGESSWYLLLGRIFN